MVSQYLSEVKELVKAKLTESIGNSNPVEKNQWSIQQLLKAKWFVQV